MDVTKKKMKTQFTMDTTTTQSNIYFFGVLLHDNIISRQLASSSNGTSLCVGDADDDAVVEDEDEVVGCSLMVTTIAACRIGVTRISVSHRG